MPRKIKMRKRSRKVTGVARSPRTETRGRCSITHCADPGNNVSEDVSARKRRAVDDGEMPVKRMRCSNLTIFTDHCEGSVEDMKIKRGKRKASEDASSPEKKSRCSVNCTNTTDPSVEDLSVEKEQGEASDGVEAPNKSIRCTDSTGCHDSFIPLPSYSEFDTDVKESTSATNVGRNFNNASPEEERIFEMSSSGNTSRDDFEAKYCQLGLIGSGGFGSVYEGFRKSDDLPVAIKLIHSKAVTREKVTCNGKVFDIILEVAFMLKTAGLPGSVRQSAAVSLLDWYTLDQELILVMERPVPSKDLYQYLQSRRGSLDESEAKMILKQLVDAAVDMHSKGVFHRDIKLNNVLVQLDSDTPRVRIIDFGCSSFSTAESYYSYCGTRAYFPPEWFDYDTYWARPTTVWQLGALFFSLLSGHKPFTTMAFICNHIQINSALSTETKTLLNMCLTRDPMERATLEDLQDLPAFR